MDRELEAFARDRAALKRLRKGRRRLVEQKHWGNRSMSLRTFDDRLMVARARVMRHPIWKTIARALKRGTLEWK